MKTRAILITILVAAFALFCIPVDARPLASGTTTYYASDPAFTDTWLPDYNNMGTCESGVQTLLTPITLGSTENCYAPDISGVAAFTLFQLVPSDAVSSTITVYFLAGTSTTASFAVWPDYYPVPQQAYTVFGEPGVKSLSITFNGGSIALGWRLLVGGRSARVTKLVVSWSGGAQATQPPATFVGYATSTPVQSGCGVFNYCNKFTTPTPFAPPSSVDLHLFSEGQRSAELNFANTAINTYRYLNTSGIITVVIAILFFMTAGFALLNLARILGDRE